MEIHQTRYCTEDGRVLLEDPIVFRRLWRVDQRLIVNYKSYVVTAVEIKDGVEIVTVRPG